jgi:hypothetical protein
MNYTISNQIPLIYYMIKRTFPSIHWDRGVVIAYGTTIYARDPLPDHLVEHEKVHLKQQHVMGAKEWWDRYLVDKQFRLDQEIEAYKVQVQHIQQNKKIRKPDREKLIKWVIEQLSGPMYGGIISYQEAKDILLNGNNTNEEQKS